MPQVPNPAARRSALLRREICASPDLINAEVAELRSALRNPAPQVPNPEALGAEPQVPNPEALGAEKWTWTLARVELLYGGVRALVRQGIYPKKGSGFWPKVKDGAFASTPEVKFDQNLDKKKEDFNRRGTSKEIPTEYLDKIFLLNEEIEAAKRNGGFMTDAGRKQSIAPTIAPDGGGFMTDARRKQSIAPTIAPHGGGFMTDARRKQSIAPTIAPHGGGVMTDAQSKQSIAPTIAPHGGEKQCPVEKLENAPAHCSKVYSRRVKKVLSPCYQTMASSAVDAAKKAGQLIKKGLDEINERKVQVYSKQCEDLILNHLRSLHPTHKFITPACGVTELTNDPTWIVDPLNGTTNFVHSFPYVCVSIGFTLQKIPTIGVVYNPINDELFTGIRDSGALLNGKPIKVSSQSELVNSLVATEAGTTSDSSSVHATTGIPNFKVKSTRMTGSYAWNLCAIACGRLDLFYALGGSPWDVAGGAVIVTAAGGSVYDPSGKDLNIISPSFAASNPLLKDAFVKALQDQETSMGDPLGLLKVTVVQGKQLVSRDFMTSSPYVVVKLGSQMAKTKVINSGLNPIWNEELTFSTTEPIGVLNLEVFDNDGLKRDDKMGHAQLSLEPIVSAARAVQMLGLSSFGETTFTELIPDSDNCLVGESTITCVDGEVVQSVWLRLCDVESGELELKIKLSGAPVAASR